MPYLPLPYLKLFFDHSEDGLYPNGLRCSALFKLTNNDNVRNGEIFFGHDTWDTYATAAPRIFKHVTLPVWQDGKAKVRTVSFSSSPGFLVSIDDYYVVKGLSSYNPYASNLNPNIFDRH